MTLAPSLPVEPKGSSTGRGTYLVIVAIGLLAAAVITRDPAPIPLMHRLTATYERGFAPSSRSSKRGATPRPARARMTLSPPDVVRGHLDALPAATPERRRAEDFQPRIR